MAQASLLTPDAPVSGADSVTRASLGAHILAEIARCNGPQLPCWSSDQILDGFWARFGPDGMAICERAFGVHNGMWCGAPVTLLRFQQQHDAYFAIPLLEEARTSQETSNRD